MHNELLSWGVFAVIVVTLLVLDLGVLHKKEREISVRESLLMSGFYIAIALIFGGWVWHSMGAEYGKEYFTGYLIEKSLSMDNIFVISLIFGFLNIPRAYQHRVLFWGIIGAIVMRGVMIGAGAALIHKFEWIVYFFAAFLVFTGIKMLTSKDESVDLNENRFFNYLKKHLRLTSELNGRDFYVDRVDESHPEVSKRYFTPLFVALVMVEAADLVFAVDSIPAIFTITTDTYIVYTSNIFAILGLRALYFALSAVIEKFHYLKYALALILMFIGGKVFAPLILGIEKVPASVSLSVTLLVLAGGVVVSLLKTRKE